MVNEQNTNRPQFSLPKQQFTGHRECSYRAYLGKLFYLNKTFSCVALYYEHFITDNLCKKILDNIGTCVKITVLNT